MHIYMCVYTYTQNTHTPTRVNHLPVCLHVHQYSIWYLWKSEEDIYLLHMEVRLYTTTFVRN